MTDAQATPGPRLATASAADTAVVRGVVPTGELPSFFDRSFAALGAALTQLGATPSGPAFAYYLRPPEDTSELEVGFPVNEPVPPGSDVVPSRLPGGRVATVVHHGGYDGLGESWRRLQEWAARQGLSPATGFWEVYLTEPTPAGDPAANRTALYLRLRD
ncbi:GyrI-like domain-containing protein [Geodermatophilus nigrescens]